MMRLKFVRKRVRMVAYIDLLGESGTLILIASICQTLWSELLSQSFTKFTRQTLMISNDTQSSSEDSISQSY